MEDSRCSPRNTNPVLVENFFFVVVVGEREALEGRLFCSVCTKSVNFWRLFLVMGVLKDKAKRGVDEFGVCWGHLVVGYLFK